MVGRRGGGTKVDSEQRTAEVDSVPSPSGVVIMRAIGHLGSVATGFTALPATGPSPIDRR